MNRWPAVLGLLLNFVACDRSSVPPVMERQSAAAPSATVPSGQTPAVAPSTAAPVTPDIAVNWWSGLELRSLVDARQVYEADAADNFGPLKLGATIRQPRNCVEWTQLSAGGYEPVDGLAAQTDEAQMPRVRSELVGATQLWRSCSSCSRAEYQSSAPSCPMGQPRCIQIS
jgi:hypothetical protein